MRIASWNVNKSRAAWGATRDLLRADYALLQETIPAHATEMSSSVAIGGGYSWGSAVASFSTSLEAVNFPMASGPDGWVRAAATTAVDGERYTFISVHVPEDRVNADYYATSLLRILADVLPAAARLTRRNRSHVILGGDFNVNPAIKWSEWIAPLLQ
jgi:exonuclease III